MPCRSSAKRRNANARHIAARAACEGSNARRFVQKNGAFTDETARIFATTKTTHPVDAERCREVSWALTAEMMNRATKFTFVQARRILDDMWDAWADKHIKADPFVMH